MDRPPPTSYRDEQGVFHPGPGTAGYVEHTMDCPACHAAACRAYLAGESWARGYASALVALTARPAPTFLPGPGEGALVASPRTLPARWRRYAAPGPLVCLVAGATGAWLLPATVGAALIVVLIVAAVAIHRYVPDAVPAARAIRR